MGPSGCLFDDLRRDGRKRPCDKCKNRKVPFRAESQEALGICEWWAAEGGHGSVAFRCFPGSEIAELPKTPEKRFAYIEREYAESLEAARARIRKLYKHRPWRGAIWLVAPVNVAFASMMNFGPVRKYRFAAACEVASWLAAHRDDFAALKRQEDLVVELEEYV